MKLTLRMEKYPSALPFHVRLLVNMQGILQKFMRLAVFVNTKYWMSNTSKYCYQIQFWKLRLVRKDGLVFFVMNAPAAFQPLLAEVDK